MREKLRNACFVRNVANYNSVHFFDYISNLRNGFLLAVRLHLQLSRRINQKMEIIFFL